MHGGIERDYRVDQFVRHLAYLFSKGAGQVRRRHHRRSAPTIKFRGKCDVFTKINSCSGNFEGCQKKREAWWASRTGASLHEHQHFSPLASFSSFHFPSFLSVYSSCSCLLPYYSSSLLPPTNTAQSLPPRCTSHQPRQ